MSLRKKDSAPRFVEDFAKTKELIKGQKAELSVVVTGKPRPILTWYKGGRRIQNNDQRYSIIPERNGRQTLTINAVRSRDAGEYKVIAENSSGRQVIQSSIKITRDPLNITTVWDPNIETEIGEKVFCPVAISPTSKNRHYEREWIHLDSGSVVKNTDRIEIENKDELSILSIKNARLEDSGKYKCIVKGKATGKSITFTVKVTDEPVENKYERRNLSKYQKLSGSISSLKDIICNTISQFKRSKSTPTALDSAPLLEESVADKRSSTFEPLEERAELSRFLSVQTVNLMIPKEIEQTARLNKAANLLEKEKKQLEDCLMKMTRGGVFVWEYMCYKLIGDKTIENDLYFVRYPNRKDIAKDMFDALYKKRPAFTVGEFCDIVLERERGDIHDILVNYPRDKRFKAIEYRDRLELYILCSKNGWKLIAEDLHLDSSEISRISNRIPNNSVIESSVMEMFKFLSMKCPSLTLLEMLSTLRDIDAVEAFDKLVDIIKEKGKRIQTEKKIYRSCISIPVGLGQSVYDFENLMHFGFETAV